jgi:hypothetical protein
MVTLAGLEPATSPAPGEQGRSIPLELQRRHDLHDRLWRRRGVGSNRARKCPPPLPAAVVRRRTRRLLRRERQRTAEAGLCLFRRRAGTAISGEVARARRGAADRCEHCEAAEILKYAK